MKLHFTIAFLFMIFLSCNSKAQTNLDSTLEDYQNEILGTWVLESDSQTRFEFLENGIIKTYYGSELRSIENYIITNSCENDDQDSDEIILKQFSDDDSDFFCSYIEGLNFEGSNMMSLMSFNQGKIVVLVRE